MKRHHGLIVLTALASAFLLAGCWGSTKSTSVSLTGGSSVADTATAVGIQKCLTCHQNRRDVSNPADNATTIFADWQASIHGLGSTSHVDYAFMNGYGCTFQCHDPNGDGKNLLALGIATEKPVVGCEGCHGGGSEHYGVGPMAYPKPNPTVCGQCHDQNMPHPTYHPNGRGGKGDPGIYAAYAASPHARSATASTSWTAQISARCSRCHTDEGARKFSLNDNVASGSPIDCAVLNPALTEFSSVQCRTCHKAHKAPELLAGASTGKSAQYNTCTRCHQETPQIHTSHAAQIAKTHYDNASRALGQPLGGLNIKKDSATACTACHNPHSADLTENKQWAASGHGDKAAFPWTEDDWKNELTCRRCHTSTHFVIYSDNQVAWYSAPTYDNSAGFSYLSGTQNEMLYCWACHKMDVTGYTVARRAVAKAYLPSGPSQVTTDNLAKPEATSKLVTGMGDSELCINCHAGRKAGSQVKAIIDNVSVVDNISRPLNMNNTSFSSFNPHYLGAAQMLFQDNVSQPGYGFTGPGCYQFPGMNYAKVAWFAHDNIDTASGKGPCVACHMSYPNSATDEAVGKHMFMPFTYDNAVTRATITGVTPKCAECHAGQYALSVAQLNALRTEYEDRLALLKSSLAAKGIYYDFSAGRPYFFNDPVLRASGNQVKRWTDNAAAISAATGIPITATDLVGIAYNLHFLSSSPGGWAHNDVYVNRVLFDSIRRVAGDNAVGFTRP